MAKDIRKTIRFSADEFSIIDEQLKTTGLTFAEFVRVQVLKQKIKMPIERDFLKELNSIGVNLNQIAKAINQNPKKDKIKIISRLIEIEKALKSL